MGLIIAIDGPAGAGKSTVARAVAKHLGFTEVNTGAIYRALTLWALEQGVEGSEQLTEMARNIELRFEGEQVFLHGEDVTSALRSEMVNKKVSQVSAIPAVRSELLALQRNMARAHPSGAVLEGRDVGTVVFPDADIKIFLTASAEERARRRHAEMLQAGSDLAPPSVGSVQASIERRDALDGSRVVAPLRAAEDATVVDTTGTTLAEVVAKIVALVEAVRFTPDDHRDGSLQS